MSLFRRAKLNSTMISLLTLLRRWTGFPSGFFESPWQAPSWFDHKRLLKYDLVVCSTCREKPQSHFSFHTHRSDFFVTFCFVLIKFLTKLARYISQLEKPIKINSRFWKIRRNRSYVDNVHTTPGKFENILKHGAFRKIVFISGAVSNVDVLWLVTKSITVLTWFY